VPIASTLAEETSTPLTDSSHAAVICEGAAGIGLDVEPSRVDRVGEVMMRFCSVRG
jgi:hypothetical protein